MPPTRVPLPCGAPFKFHAPLMSMAMRVVPRAASLLPVRLWRWFFGYGDGCDSWLLGGVLFVMGVRLPNAQMTPS